MNDQYIFENMDGLMNLHKESKWHLSALPIWLLKHIVLEAIIFFSLIFPCNKEVAPFTHPSVLSLLFFMSTLKRPFVMRAEYPQDFRELKLWLTKMVNIVPPPTF